MKKIHCLQHVPFEPPSRIADWAESRSVGMCVVRAFAGEPFPAGEDVEALVVMGGPMGVGDERVIAWLAEEKRLIERALHAGKPVFGVCLGAQLVADVLGARVHRNRFQEIGWFGVEATGAGREHARFRLPREFVPFHWHGDTFDLPEGAVHLARSAACEQQAFAWGDRVLALQFHLEVTPADIEEMVVHCGKAMGSGPYVQTRADMLATPSRFDAANALLETLLDSWKESSHESA